MKAWEKLLLHSELSLLFLDGNYKLLFACFCLLLCCVAQIVAALTKIVPSVAKIAGNLLHIQDARQCISTERQYRGLTGKYRWTVATFRLPKNRYFAASEGKWRKSIFKNDDVIVRSCIILIFYQRLKNPGKIGLFVDGTKKWGVRVKQILKNGNSFRFYYFNDLLIIMSRVRVTYILKKRI